MSRTQVQLWCNRCKEDREDVNDDARPRRQSMSTTYESIEAVKKMILDNRPITTSIREIAYDVGISFGSSQRICMDVLGIKRAASKTVPELLNFEQKQRRMGITQEILTTFNDDSDLLKNFISGDESWIYGYDIETKAQSARFTTIDEIKVKSKH